MNVINLESRRAARAQADTESKRDQELNVAWNRFVTLSETAWSWRDPGSFAAVELCLQTLRLMMLPEWAEELDSRPRTDTATPGKR